ncbi:MAG: alpha-glucosidase C-terminal domain-containing protein [Prolixibacteraceae bacterium]|nr:alpha-glucosidase C-terminal domain-containing protein [Prolixibacteraceae bacterium]
MKQLVIFIVILTSMAMASCKSKKVEEDKRANPASEAFFPEWSHDAVIYEVNIRQYTPEGTFKAFQQHLPRLKELGVEILWFMPIHPISEKNRKGTLGSYYAVQDYKKVNPEFGTLDDFKMLVDVCHKLGFKVLLDWVANHTGWDNVWIAEHPEWYTTDSTDAIVSPVADWSDVADLNYDKHDMRAAMIDALKYWVNEADIDGYRCDVAGMVPVGFWEDARAALDSIKPVYMLAEDEGVKELLKKAFNMNYGWHFHHIINQIAKGEAGVKEVKDYFALVDSTYPAGSYPMQFTSNHDENSWNGTVFERLGNAAETMAALTFTIPGMPLIYTGQEAGNTKRLEFFEKDEVDWSNLEMQEFYSGLINLKQENSALWNGESGAPILFLSTSDESNLLAFSRAKDNSKVLAFFNLSENPVHDTIDCTPAPGIYSDAFSGKEVKIEGQYPVSLEGWGYTILVE